VDEPAPQQGATNPTATSGSSAPVTATAGHPGQGSTERDAAGDSGNPGNAGTPEPAPASSTAQQAQAVPVTPAPVVATPATAPTGTAAAVAAQVLPVVPRLVTRGEGTHSLTLKLHPADLGEVHLTVTVRAGKVDVTLAAGPAARDALRDGTGQLRSMLDLTGHTTGQLVVRDLPSGPPAPAPAAPPANDASFTSLSYGDPGAGGRRPDAGPGRPGGDPSGGPAGRTEPGPATSTTPTTSTGAAAGALDVRI
jgi:hypothetical protein